MRRREFIAVLGGAATTWPLVPAAQAAVSRIGLLSIGTDPGGWQNPVWVSFLRGMDELGWTEGRNISLERRFAGGHVKLLPQLVADLARLGLDVVVVTGEPETRAAKAAMPTTPIVMLLVPDPVGAGLVTSLARPGGNVTGLSTLAPEVYAKRLQLLKEAVPGLTRVGMLINPTPVYAETAMRHTALAAQEMGLDLRRLAVGGPEELDTAFATIAEEKLTALIVVTDGVTFNQRARIAQLTTATRLPAMYEIRDFVDVGGLISYGPSYADLARRGASYVDRILRGSKPADLPVEQPTMFELVINLKTAKALGLTIPPTLLARADDVIE
jgi:putative tryptophan/tyrosine transport system substrate-binding protein